MGLKKKKIKQKCDSCKKKTFNYSVFKSEGKTIGYICRPCIQIVIDEVWGKTA